MASGNLARAPPEQESRQINDLSTVFTRVPGEPKRSGNLARAPPEPESLQIVDLEPVFIRILVEPREAEI